METIPAEHKTISQQRVGLGRKSGAVVRQMRIYANCRR
jgi:hypothetical protein